MKAPNKSLKGLEKQGRAQQGVRVFSSLPWGLAGVNLEACPQSLCRVGFMGIISVFKEVESIIKGTLLELLDRETHGQASKISFP